MTYVIDVHDFIEGWSKLPFVGHHTSPWAITGEAEALIASISQEVGSDFHYSDTVAIHRSAVIEQGAVIKGPAIIGANCFVASNAYLRGGVYLGRECVVGPGCEVKSSFMLDNSKVAHLSFMGDSIVGAKVNIEAGAIIANHRNEYDDKAIRISWQNQIIETGVTKFGALIGDRACIGANAVIAPGALLNANSIVDRLALIDQSPDDEAGSRSISPCPLPIV